jgi:hypothetical protein
MMLDLFCRISFSLDFSSFHLRREEATYMKTSWREELNLQLAVRPATELLNHSGASLQNRTEI